MSFGASSTSVEKCALRQDECEKEGNVIKMEDLASEVITPRELRCHLFSLLLGAKHLSFRQNAPNE